MDIKISEHAAQRMAERNISEEAVRKAFDAEDWETATLITCYPRR